MNKRFKKSDFYFGLILGVTIPLVVGCFLGLFLFSQYEIEPWGLFRRKLGAPILALASLFNLIFFQMALSKRRNGLVRGIVGGTIIIAMVVLSIKLTYWWLES